MSAPGRDTTPSVSGPEHDVVVLRWPAEASTAEALAATGALRLLLVDPDADPPIVDDGRADWIRLPADERDVAARVVGLMTRHSRSDAETPFVDRSDRLFYGGQWVALSPIEARLAATLGRTFGAIVSPDELIQQAWPNGRDPASAVTPTPSTLRVHLTRLRRRIEPLGLAIRGVRGKGLAMEVIRDRVV